MGTSKRTGLSRRAFLERGGAGLAAAGLAAAGCESGLSIEAEGDAPGPWGSALEAQQEAFLPAGRQPEAVLDIFMIGGFNPWDTFYVVPEFGDPAAGGKYAGTMWWTFQDGENSIPEWFNRCDGGGRDLTEPWGLDAAGRAVHLGPFLYPLRDRPDITNRMRMWVMTHGLGAHELAIPLSLCGHLPASTKMATTAAHVQRFLSERGSGSRTNPWTSLIYPGLGDLADLNGDTAGAIGLHRGSARPVTLRLGPSGLPREALERVAVAERRSELDRAVLGYLDRLERSLVRPAGAGRVRARAVDDFRAARRALEGSDALVELIGAEGFEGAMGMECSEWSEADYTNMGLRLATRMLTATNEPARYITLMDGGLLPALGGGAYDTHVKHVHHSARNVVHLFKELASRVNEPGESDPNKLDLDRHTVLITTEFGRTPYAVGDGLNHWAESYVVVAFGGPFDEERSGIVGSIDEAGFTRDSTTPAEFRAALLLMQGIWPFTGESFNLADVPNLGSDARELDASVYLRERVLGYSL